MLFEIRSVQILSAEKHGVYSLSFPLYKKLPFTYFSFLFWIKFFISTLYFIVRDKIFDFEGQINNDAKHSSTHFLFWCEHLSAFFANQASPIVLNWFDLKNVALILNAILACQSECFNLHNINLVPLDFATHLFIYLFIYFIYHLFGFHNCTNVSSP